MFECEEDEDEEEEEEGGGGGGGEGEETSELVTISHNQTKLCSSLVNIADIP